MEIRLLYFDSCPNVDEAERRLRQAIGDRTDVSLVLQQVLDAEEAERVGLHGSPTILIDGDDPFGSGQAASWSCRLYLPPDGSDGVPSLQRLTEVLAR